MSRTDQFTVKKNPSQLTIEWAGAADAGHLKTYDKEAKENIVLGGMTFAILTERNCVSGWHEDHRANAFSNEVGNLKSTPLTVKVWDGDKPKELIEGMYADIKDGLKSKGVKYHKVVFIMVIDSPDVDTGTIAKLMLKGAAAGAYFELKDKKRAVKCAGSTDGQTGAVKYKMPKFVPVDIEQGASEEAELAYEQVKAYFSVAPVEAAPAEADESGDTPF